MRKYLMLGAAMVLMSGSVWAEIVTGSPESGNGCGANCSWSYDTTTGELTISGTGKMDDYEEKAIDGKQVYGYYNGVKTYYSSAPWGIYQVNSITIENGIENVGNHAFQGTNISTIDFPPSVTTLGTYSFLESKIQSVEIPETVTSFIGSIFQSCTNLTNVVLPDNMTYISSWMFGGARNLEDIEIPENIGSIGFGAFTQTKIESLIIPSAVTDVSERIFTNSGGEGTAPYLQHLYCTAAQMEKCEEALETAKKDFKPTRYEKEGNDYLVYDGKGNVVGKYASAMNLNKGVATETYKYDSAGHLVGIFDGNGQRTWGKKIYTVEEAMEATKDGDKFHVRLTYK